MKTPYVVTAGSGFDAGVIPAGPLERAPVVPKRDMIDDTMAALTALAFQKELLSGKDNERELHRIISERMTNTQCASEFLERCQARAREKRAAEWEVAKAAIRQQQKKIDAHKKAILGLQQELNQAQDARAQAIAARDGIQQEKGSLSRYSERREIERVNLLLLKREAEAEHATQETGALQMRINHMTLVESKPLAEKLNELVAEEARLNHFLSGQGYTNELGIVVPARPPL